MTTTTSRSASQAPAEPALPDWLPVQRAVAAVLIVGFVVLQVVLAGGVIPPLIVFSVLFVVALVVSRRRARMATIAIGVLSLLVLGGNAPFVVSDLSHPASFLNFTVQLVLLVAALVGIAAGALTIARRNPVRPVLGVAAVVVIAGVAASAAAAGGAKDDAAVAGDVAVVAQDIEFAPTRIELEAGESTLRVDNRDAGPHTLTIDELDIDTPIEAGKARRITADFAPGTYEFYCDIPGHDDMKGTIVVR